MNKFSKKEALQFGWDKTKSNFWFFVLFLLAFIALYLIPYAIAIMIMGENAILGLIALIADYALTILILMGLLRVALNFCDNKESRISDLFSQYRLFLSFLLALILYTFITFGGTLLFIIPGIIWGIQFWFFDYLIIDKGLNPVEALKKSSAITKGHKWNLFLFLVILAGINLLGAIALGIGLFITIPVTMISMAFVYRGLLKQNEIASEPASSEEAIKEEVVTA